MKNVECRINPAKHFSYIINFFLHSSFCILHSAFGRRRVRAGSTGCGFTLIEVLVALVVVTVTISVVLESQLVSLKIEQKARILQLFRFETQRIFSITQRAKNERQLLELPATGGLGRVKSGPVQMESGTNITTLMKYELGAEDLPSFSSVFYTGIPACFGKRAGPNNDFISRK